MRLQLRRWSTDVRTRRTIVRILIYAATYSNARFFLIRTDGVVTLLLATAMVLAALLAVRDTAELAGTALGWNLGSHHLATAALAAGSVMLTLVCIEAGLQIAARLGRTGGRDGVVSALAMPAEWQRRSVQIEGAAYAYYWHNALHVHNREGMRLLGNFPPRRPDTLRIIVLGDSLTYGYGIDERDTYPRVLERLLRDTYRVEVLNLGVSGMQSEDIYRILQVKLPALQPGVVLYGVCLNDFLPSRVGEYSSNRAYPVPLPYKEHFLASTLTGKLLERQYDALLMRLGLRVDFFTDILRDFDGYQRRFARDVKAMNAFVLEHGLPPIVALVLDQYPSTKERRYEIVLAAEKHLRTAGIHLVPSEYIRWNDGRLDWSVSRWEGHPNEKANRVFAEEFAKVLRELPALQPYRQHAANGNGLRLAALPARARGGRPTGLSRRTQAPEGGGMGDPAGTERNHT